MTPDGTDLRAAEPASALASPTSPPGPASPGPSPDAPTTARGVLEAHVTAHDVSVGFGAKAVLSGVTVGFRSRTINALIGPTGSGKSTFLRSLNRMNDKMRGYWRTGRIELQGEEVAGAMDPLVLRRRMGMVFQRPNPFPMSIQDNVTAGVRAHRLAPRRQLGEVAERHLKEVGLWSAVADRLDDSPFRLSGGQQQLLCLARALAVGPEVLLLDEPTSSLDPVTTEMVESMLSALAERLTMVIVTHNLAQARRIATTTTFFYNGKLVESGETDRIFEAPECPETVSYVSGRIG